MMWCIRRGKRMKGRSEEYLNGFSELLGTDLVIGESQQVSKVNSNWFLSVCMHAVCCSRVPPHIK